MMMRTVAIEPKEHKEFCGTEDNLRFAGVHLLIELWTSFHLTDANRIRDFILKAVKACGATILNVDLHVFSPNGGVSGIAVLQESHLSIHTWPEYNYAAIDLFVCGTINPSPAVTVLQEEFLPTRIEVQKIKRGILP
jgi:S-adenosylmethionine decarboxylase